MGKVYHKWTGIARPKRKKNPYAEWIKNTIENRHFATCGRMKKTGIMKLGEMVPQKRNKRKGQNGMFGLVRLLLCAVLWGMGCFVVRKKERKKRRQMCFGFVLGAICLSVIIAFLPLERPFLRFSTPQAAFRYTNTWTRYDDIQIIPGTESDYVMAFRGNEGNCLILPKDAKGWGVGMGIDTTLVSFSSYDGVNVNVYRYRPTSECYVEIVALGEEIPDVVPSDGEVRMFSLPGANFCLFYAGRLQPGTTMHLNGQEIPILSSE